jgi:hypothetical protein
MAVSGLLEPLACYFCARSESHWVAPVARTQPVYWRGHKRPILDLAISQKLAVPVQTSIIHSV